MAELNDTDLTTIVKALVDEAESHRENLSSDRQKATDYYDGKMVDVPAEPNRSSVVSRDIRSTLKKAKPSLARTLLGNDKVAEFKPNGEGDEDEAEQPHREHRPEGAEHLDEGIVGLGQQFHRVCSLRP